MDSIGLMVLDMDSFKNINDLYDRSFGDEVLRITAQKVASMLPPNAMLYRLDGDEFGILLLGGDAKEAAHIYGKLQKKTSASSRSTAERNISVPCRRGYAAYPGDGSNYLELLKSANYSLEYSKIMGKNRMTRVFQGYPGRQGAAAGAAGASEGERGARLCRVHHPLPAPGRHCVGQALRS